MRLKCHGSQSDLIDDDFLVLRSLARILDAQGYETTAVNSGAKAVERVKKEDFDLVMSDIRMPVMPSSA